MKMKQTTKLIIGLIAIVGSTLLAILILTQTRRDERAQDYGDEMEYWKVMATDKDREIVALRLKSEELELEIEQIENGNKIVEETEPHEYLLFNAEDIWADDEVELLAAIGSYGISTPETIESAKEFGYYYEDIVLSVEQINNSESNLDELKLKYDKSSPEYCTEEACPESMAREYTDNKGRAWFIYSQGLGEYDSYIALSQKGQDIYKLEIGVLPHYLCTAYRPGMECSENYDYMEWMNAAKDFMNETLDKMEISSVTFIAPSFR